MDNTQMLKGLLKNALVAGSASVSTWIVTNGYLSADQVASLVSTIDWTAVASFLVMVGGFVWNALDNRKKNIIAAANALTEVAGVVTTATPAGREMARAVPSDTVVAADNPQAKKLVQAPR